MNERMRLELIAEAVRYCQRAKAMGMPSNCYTKALREPIHFLWDRRRGAKDRIAQYRSTSSIRTQRGNFELVFDHAVPFKCLQDELLALKRVSAQTVGRILRRFGVFVLVTKAEHERLNTADRAAQMTTAQYHVDPLARYKQARSKLQPNIQPKK